MIYKDKMKRLEEAERIMLEAFDKYAIEHNIDKEVKFQIIQKIQSVIKNKKAEYYLEDKFSNISESINDIISSSFSSFLDLNKKDAPSSSQKSYFKKNKSHRIAYE